MNSSIHLLMRLLSVQVVMLLLLPAPQRNITPSAAGVTVETKSGRVGGNAGPRRSVDTNRSLAQNLQAGRLAGKASLLTGSMLAVPFTGGTSVAILAISKEL